MFKNTNEESRHLWETNADFWDNYMGYESNFYHRDIVRPKTEILLDVKEGDYILDVACGTGNFSQRMAEHGARVVAFDYSAKMIAHAKRRRAKHTDFIEFSICDATDYDSLLKLKKNRPFTKAVANMAIMDISDIEPLMKAVYELLCNKGIFVFATHHPCFIKPDNVYLSQCMHKGIAVPGQPAEHNYYHRPLEKLFNCCFSAGFVIDGFYEEVFRDKEIPELIIVRLKKIG